MRQLAWRFAFFAWLDVLVATVATVIAAAFGKLSADEAFAVWWRALIAIPMALAAVAAVAATVVGALMLLFYLSHKADGSPEEA